MPPSYYFNLNPDAPMFGILERENRNGGLSSAKTMIYTSTSGNKIISTYIIMALR